MIMTKLIDLTGQRFGRLAVVCRDGTIGNQSSWKCRCDCGQLTVVVKQSLKNGNTRSCGCFFKERVREINKTHGMAHTKTYNAWCNMRRRCYEEENEKYAEYGGRGISICDRWSTFENFHADMGEAPVGMTLDREGNDGNYEPNNCRWATATQQVRNRRCTVKVTYCGRERVLAEVTESLGLDYDLMYQRIYRDGWPVEKALLTTVSPNGKRGVLREQLCSLL